MPSKIVKIFICFIMVMLLCGCWDAINIEDRDICTAVIVDKTGGEYVFSVEVAAITSVMQNPAAQEAQKNPMTNIITARGKTVADARNDIDRQLNKAIFLGAVQALIMTQNMAKSGIGEYIYRVREMNDYRKTIDVLVTPDDPQKFLNTSPENASAVGFAIENTVQNLLSHGKTIHFSLADLMDKLSSKNDAYVTSLITVKNGQLALNGYAVFSGEKMLGTVSLENSRGIIYMMADWHSQAIFNYVVPVNGTDVTAEAKMHMRKISAAFDGTLHFDLSFNIRGAVLYQDTAAPLTKETEQQVKTALEKMLLGDIVKALNISQKQFGCDFMSLSEAFRIAYPDEYNKMDWQEEFKKADFKVSVSLDLGTQRTMDYNPYKE